MTTAIRQWTGLSCTIRANKGVIKGGEKKAFFTGGNSSCQAHICQHYEIYNAQYKDGNILENHHPLPWQLYQMKVDRAKGGTQQTLDRALEKSVDVKLYMHDGVTHTVAQFIMCDDQMSAIVILCIDVDIVGPGSCSC